MACLLPLRLPFRTACLRVVRRPDLPVSLVRPFPCPFLARFGPALRFLLKWRRAWVSGFFSFSCFFDCGSGRCLLVLRCSVVGSRALLSACFGEASHSGPRSVCSDDSVPDSIPESARSLPGEDLFWSELRHAPSSEASLEDRLTIALCTRYVEQVSHCCS